LPRGSCRATLGFEHPISRQTDGLHVFRFRTISKQKGDLRLVSVAFASSVFQVPGFVNED
jgi:hypothetical protein